MKYYKEAVREKKSLLLDLQIINLRTSKEAQDLLTIIARRVSEIRFENIIHSIITSDMTPEEVIRYLTFVEIPVKEVVQNR